MQRSDFYYDLPEELIAQQPPERRGDSRLLTVNGAESKWEDRQFADLLEQVEPGDLMVFNNTRVIPARLFGRKETGGSIEILVERLCDNGQVLAHIRSSKSPKPGARLLLEDGTELTMLEREDALFRLGFPQDQSPLQVLERLGHMPLPPYIERADTEDDRERYQTVFARNPGAVAAPTAGLHFDEAMMAALREKGVQMAEVTLHVGAGTFQPVRADNLDDHKMHAEWIEVDESVCEAVCQTRERGGRVIAVGTTVCRSLESAAADGELKPFRGDSRLFLYPGKSFHAVDVLLTNFHLPESTLLMLVCAFSGYETMMSAYRHAVEQRYRFFSYGDAMLLTRAES